MAFDKFINKAKNLANDPKVREKLNSEKVEKFSDQVLDKAAGAADSLTKGKYTDKIKGARDAADRTIGSDGQPGQQPSQPGHPDRPGAGQGVPNQADAPRPGPGHPDAERPQTHRPDVPPAGDDQPPRR